jgi:hypothetical protein
MRGAVSAGAVLLWALPGMCAAGTVQPTDTDLRVAYCVPVLTSLAEDYSKDPARRTDLLEVIKARAAKASAFFVVRLGIVEPTTLLFAYKQGEADVAALHRDPNDIAPKLSVRRCVTPETLPF